jgi:hypothetical protein
VADDFRADLDELFLQARQRPVFDRFQRRKRPQKAAETVLVRTAEVGQIDREFTF